MRTLRRASIALAAVAFSFAREAAAAPQFSDGSDGAFSPPPGTIVFDTDNGTWSGAASGSGGRVVTQANSVDIEVFDFTTINIQSGVIIRAKGKRALALTATGTVVIDGFIDMRGEDTNTTTGQRGGAGGVGGGGGGGGGNSVAVVGSAVGGSGGLGAGGDGYKGVAPGGTAGADGSGVAGGKRGFEGGGGAGGGGTNSSLPFTTLKGGGGGGGGPGGGGGGAYGNGLGCGTGEGIGSGAGGSFGTVGGSSNRVNLIGSPTMPGATYGTDDLAVLFGGSGGGGGAHDAPGFNGGGGGGGAVMITSLVSITLSISGSVDVRGGGAFGDQNRPNPFNDTSVWSAGGGGSGGAIYIDAPVVNNTGHLCAAGGQGGTANPTDPGTCPGELGYIVKAGSGGGGRIVVFGGGLGDVCPSSGTTKTGDFRCDSDAQCSGGKKCDPVTKQCSSGAADAGPDATPTSDAGPTIDAGPTFDASVPDSGQPVALDTTMLEGGGCGCSTAGGGSRGFALLGAALGLGAIIARRRRR